MGNRKVRLPRIMGGLNARFRHGTYFLFDHVDPYMMLAQGVFCNAMKMLQDGQDYWERGKNLAADNKRIKHARHAWQWVMADILDYPIVVELKFAEVCDALGVDLTEIRKRVYMGLAYELRLHLMYPQQRTKYDKSNGVRELFKSFSGHSRAIGVGPQISKDRHRRERTRQRALDRERLRNAAECVSGEDAGLPAGRDGALGTGAGAPAGTVPGAELRELHGDEGVDVSVPDVPTSGPGQILHAGDAGCVAGERGFAGNQDSGPESTPRIGGTGDGCDATVLGTSGPTADGRDGDQEGSCLGCDGSEIGLARDCRAERQTHRDHCSQGARVLGDGRGKDASPAGLVAQDDAGTGAESYAGGSRQGDADDRRCESDVGTAAEVREAFQEVAGEGGLLQGPGDVPDGGLRDCIPPGNDLGTGSSGSEDDSDSANDAERLRETHRKEAEE